MAVAPRTRMRLVEFKPRVSGALRGHATIVLPNGLAISDCPVLVSNGKAWASFPGKPQLDRDLKQIVTNGKKQFTSFLSWPDSQTRERWSDLVVALVKHAHPEALG